VIIARSPLRVSLGGGGTDVPSYFRKSGGYLIAASIDKYVYATIMRPFSEGIYLKYSEIEHVNQVNEIKHPIVREVLDYLKLKTPQIEITTLADIPSGTGLGSSGSFATALIKGLFSHYRRNISQRELAELACHIEIERLNEPIGKQDQYIAAFGGITEFTFKEDGEVLVSPLPISVKTTNDLEDNLTLFFTGISRSASNILQDQVNKSQYFNSEMIKNLDHIKNIGLKSRELLIQGKTRDYGALLHEHWIYKRERSPGITNEFVNRAYEKAMRSGAIGGKLVGAGGGGFLMFYAEDKEKLKECMSDIGFPELRFRFDFDGTKVILS
jgi:D-glycero-alpha-D-manno-heptose-7-phosphate kinase